MSFENAGRRYSLDHGFPERRLKSPCTKKPKVGCKMNEIDSQGSSQKLRYAAILTSPKILSVCLLASLLLFGRPTSKQLRPQRCTDNNFVLSISQPLS